MPLAHLDPLIRHPLVFLTICTAKRARLLDNGNAQSILSALWLESREHNGWCVGRFVIMPDHVHLFAKPGDNPQPLHDWISVWKSISARRIVAVAAARPPIWQRDYFDRFLRTRESYGEKWNYVLNNPVRAGLVDKAEAWPYQGVIYELGF